MKKRAAALAAALLLLLSVPVLLSYRNSWGMSQAMRLAGTTWTVEDTSFTVLNASVQETWETESGEAVLPGKDCEFLVVECRVSLGESAKLASCTLSGSAVDSGEYSLFREPIVLTEDAASSAGNCVLLFSLPEEKASEYHTGFCCLNVCMTVGGKNYSEDFTVPVE